jgi:HPt (histidine-containing phosphotransfer) domain-containing protein
MSSSHESELEYLDISIAMEQIGDASTMQGMLTMLEENLARDIPRIGELLVQGEVRQANRVLHSLKGVIPIFCTPPICQHVSQVEELSKTGAAAEVSEAYFGLMPQLEQLQGEVAWYLNEKM